MLKPLRSIFDPKKNLGQWGCSSGQFVAHVLFFGPWTSLRGTPLAQDHPVWDPPLYCGVVWCVGAVCVQNWALSLTPPPPDPPSPDRPKFRPFSLSRLPFRSFSLSRGVFSSCNYVLCFALQDLKMCTFWLTGCREKTRWLLQHVKPATRLPKKSMTN